MSTLALDDVWAWDSNQGNDNFQLEAGSAFDLPLSMPLVLDLDGTLIAGDMLYKSFSAVLRSDALVVLRCLAWLWRGRAVLKRELARRYCIDWDRLKLHQDVLALSLREKAAGRSVVLATATDVLLAEQIAARLGIFDRVLASDGERNLKGRTKARALLRLFPQGFIYAGDGKSDLPVWRHARAMVVVDARPSVALAARAFGRPTVELSGRVAR